jgi:DNA invertase Pin-like site-specific DNA recombinase
MRSHILAMAKRLASPKRPRAFGYVRVSTSRQADEGGSLEAQREGIARHAVLSGYDLVGMGEDAGISGGKGEDKRPGLAAALDAIRARRADVLIVTHADRLARNIDEAGHIRVEVKRAGAKVDVIAEVKDDPIRSAVDRMLAELERIRGSQRMAAWNAGRKAKGLPAGPAPYGFRIGGDGHLAAEPSEMPTVGRIKAMRASGASLRAVAAALNAGAVPTRTGKAWNAMTVSNIEKRA